VASAGGADLTLLPLPGQIPAPPIPANLASFQIPGGPAVDLTPAIAALLTPPAELLSLQSVTSRAVGQCTSGQPALTATSAATGLRMLGLSNVTLPGGAALPALKLVRRMALTGVRSRRAR
jgi:hypothetical protein